MAVSKPFLSTSVWALLLLSSVAAEAQPAKPNSDACSIDPACERHYIQARKLFNAGQLEESLNEHQQAYALQRVPTLLFNIARLNHKLGRLKEAASAYSAYLNQESGTEAELTAKAKEYLAQIQRELLPPAPLAQPPEKPVDKSENVTPPVQAQAPVALLVPPAQPQASEAVPIYKKWWLWTAVGGVVLVGTIGIVVGTQVAPLSKPDLIFDLRGQL